MNFAAKLTNMQQRLAIIDNEDSFTYNLVQIIRESNNCELSIFSSEKVSIFEIADFDKILISPGAGIPSERPILNAIIDKYHKIKPILGICLGHQAIGAYFGAKLMNLSKVFHGQKQNINIINAASPLFKDIPSSIEVGLYHSWAIENNNLPDCLIIDAISENGVIMAISHQHFNVKGLQFHPESYMTKFGNHIINNWLNQPNIIF